MMPTSSSLRRSLLTWYQLTQDLPAIQLRHLHVQQHQVRAQLAVAGEGGFAIGGAGAAQPGAGQVGAENVSDFAFILGNQHQGRLARACIGLH